MKTLIVAIFLALLVAGSAGADNNPSISQVATQVANTEQTANANCNATGDESTQTITVNCSASNNVVVVQQICQQVVERMVNSQIICDIHIDTNVPVPGPQGVTGATGPQGPSGPPGAPGITPMPVPLPAGMSCPDGSTGGFVIEFVDPITGPILGPDGKPIYYHGGPICNGRDAVQCPNMGLMKYHTAHEISVMTGVIRVQTFNLRRQVVCVSLAIVHQFQVERIQAITKAITKTKTSHP